jgi:hypothetical protein
MQTNKIANVFNFLPEDQYGCRMAANSKHASIPFLCLDKMYEIMSRIFDCLVVGSGEIHDT